MPSNRSKSDIRPPRLTPKLWVGSAIAVASLLFFAWFLTLPVLNGYFGANGELVTRLQFFSRILLPEIWLQEWTAEGRLPLEAFDRIPILITALIWLGIGYLTGAPLIDRTLDRSQLMRSEHISLATLAGLAILSSVTLLLGLVGASASRWPLLGAVACVVAVALWMRHSSANNRTGQAAPSFQQPPWLGVNLRPQGVFGQLAGRLVISLTILLAVFYLFGCVMPPYEFDVVEYHLQAAKEFYQQGHIGFVSHNIYMNMPLGAEMHSLAAMSLVNGSDGWWLGGLIGKTVTGAHALLAAMLVGGLCARWCGKWVGWCAAGLWLSVPGNAHVSYAGLVDVVLGAYVLAATVMLWKLWRGCSNSICNELDRAAPPSDNSQSMNSAWLVFLASLFAGAAAAIKYPGLIIAVLPCGAVVVARALSWLRQDRASGHQVQKRIALWAFSGLIGCLLTWVPWYVKNAVLAHNPVYPLAYSVLGGRDMDDQRAEQWAAAHRVPVDLNVASPYSLTAAASSVKQVWVASTFAQPALTVLLACAAVICGSALVKRLRSTGREPQTLEGKTDAVLYNLLSFCFALALWIFAVWWFATHRIDRFWLPAIPLCCIAAGVGVFWIAQRISHSLATVIVLVGLSYGGMINSSQVIGDNRFLVSLSALRSDSGDEKHVGRLSPAIGWCNANVSPQQTKLALVGEARVFDFRIPIVYSTCFDRSPVESWLRAATPEQQLENLHKNEITHVLVNWAELARYRSPGNYGFSDWPQRADFQALVDAGVLLPMTNPLNRFVAEVFEVAERPGSSEPPETADRQ